jgi:hypothetical protein
VIVHRFATHDAMMGYAAFNQQVCASRACAFE